MTEPLNKINVLDKGYVALVSASIDGKTLKGIYDGYFRTKINKELWHLASMTLLVKCPLFKQLHLARHNFRIVQLPTKDEIEVYTPDVSEVQTGDSQDDADMAKYFSQVTESLLMSSKALQQDGCDKFLSQVITPISAYNTILVHGSLDEWIKYIKQSKLPPQLEAYRATVEGIMTAEWQQLDTYKKGI